MTKKQIIFLNGSSVPYIALIIAMIIWGSSFVALKISFRHFNPFFVVFMRQLLAAVVFIPFVWRHFKRVRREDLLLLIAMALFEPSLYYIFEAKALTLTSASQAGMITTMLPVMVAIPSALILKERISIRTIVGFAVAISGVIWLTMGGSATEESPDPVLGNFLEFLAMACAAGYTILLKKLSSRYSPFFLTAIQAFVGTIFFFPVFFVVPGAVEMDLTLQSGLILVFLGIVVTIGAYSLYNFGTSRIPANQSAAFINLIPVVTLIVSMIVLGERLSPVQYVASALVVLGIIYSQDRTKEEVPVY